MARVALAEFAVPPRRIQFVALDTNAVYRVFTATETYALRLALPGWRTADDLRLAAAWQTALAEETDMVVPRPVVARSGATLVHVSGGATEPDRMATLEAWLPGGLLGRRLTTGNAAQFGGLFAAMHAHGRAWQPSADVSARRVFEGTLSRGEPDVWAEVAGTVGSSERDVDIIREAASSTERAYAALDPADRQIIHGDLHHDNVKLWRGRLCPFDFEDTVVGHRCHDIAMAMLDLFDEVGPAAYPSLLDAFRTGYLALEPWPDADILPFQVGRRIWVLNWIARHRPDDLGRALAKFARTIDETLQRSRLTLVT
jgi:Ser/Thr protein kinase RdoA (MazF antagonist)